MRSSVALAIGWFASAALGIAPYAQICEKEQGHARHGKHRIPPPGHDGQPMTGCHACTIGRDGEEDDSGG